MGYDYLTPDKTLYLSEDAVAWMNVFVKPPNEEYSYTDYPAIGYYTDYSMDMLIKPTMNAQAFAEKEMLPENADFISLSADSISLSGVTYVPTELSVGDAVYTVLAAVQPETPEQPADPEGE